MFDLLNIIQIQIHDLIYYIIHFNVQKHLI